MQNVKYKAKVSPILLNWVFAALFAALITVATMFIKIPTLLGYVHVGDAFIYLASCVLPAPFAMAASAIGGGLADLLSGYPHWVVPTAIIKLINTLPFIICRYFLKKKNKDNKIIRVPNLLMLIPTSLVTIFGYFIAHLLMNGWAYAVAGLTAEWIQPTASGIIFVALGVALDGMKFRENILRS